MEERIRKAVDKALGGAKFTVERPNPAHGDYAVFIGMEKAEEVAEGLKKELGDSVSKVNVVKPGFVNITLAADAIAFVIDEAEVQGRGWGKNNKLDGKRVLIEYTDPNPFKEMHIGHLMSNTIGEAISRLTSNEGAQVIRANYQGDVGPHVAKAIWALLQERKEKGETFPLNLTDAFVLGNAYARGSKAYEDSESAKKEIDEINTKIYLKTGGSDINLIYDWGAHIKLGAF